MHNQFSNDTDSRYRQATKIVPHVTDNVITRLSWATSRHKGTRETILLLKLTNPITRVQPNCARSPREYVNLPRSRRSHGVP